jgi:hypothetical protein
MPVGKRVTEARCEGRRSQDFRKKTELSIISVVTLMQGVGGRNNFVSLDKPLKNRASKKTDTLTAPATGEGAKRVATLRARVGDVTQYRR